MGTPTRHIVIDMEDADTDEEPPSTVLGTGPWADLRPEPESADFFDDNSSSSSDLPPVKFLPSSVKPKATGLFLESVSHQRTIPPQKVADAPTTITNPPPSFLQSKRKVETEPAQRKRRHVTAAATVNFDDTTDEINDVTQTFTQIVDSAQKEIEELRGPPPTQEEITKMRDAVVRIHRDQEAAAVMARMSVTNTRQDTYHLISAYKGPQVDIIHLIGRPTRHEWIHDAVLLLHDIHRLSQAVPDSDNLIETFGLLEPGTQWVPPAGPWKRCQLCHTNGEQIHKFDARISSTDSAVIQIAGNRTVVIQGHFWVVVYEGQARDDYRFINKDYWKDAPFRTGDFLYMDEELFESGAAIMRACDAVFRRNQKIILRSETNPFQSEVLVASETRDIALHLNYDGRYAFRLLQRPPGPEEHHGSRVRDATDQEKQILEKSGIISGVRRRFERTVPIAPANPQQIAKGSIEPFQTITKLADPWKLLLPELVVFQ